jgi:hypothetical protein
MLPPGAAVVLRFSRTAAPNMPNFVSVGLTLQSIALNGQTVPVSSNVIARVLPAAAAPAGRAITYSAGMSLLFIVSAPR